MKNFYFIFTILFFSFFSNSFAFAPEEHLPDDQEQRARELFLQIKCPVCSGQVIESSDAPVAFELRKSVRDKIKMGESDEEIKKELVENYGADILVVKDIKKNNFIIYLLPILFVAAGVWFFLRNYLLQKNKENSGLEQDL